MKRLTLTFVLLMIFFYGNAQSESDLTNSPDSVAISTNKLLTEILNLQESRNLAERYKIYPTDNINILIQLDTQTGRIQLIQWSLKSEGEFTMYLNPNDLSCHEGLNSFELYPTKNMYQFILLDKATGRNWHVQWGTERSKMWIRPIY